MDLHSITSMAWQPLPPSHSSLNIVKLGIHITPSNSQSITQKNQNHIAMTSLSTSSFTGPVLRLPSLLSPQNPNQSSLLSLKGNPDRIRGNRIACKSLSFCPKASLRGNLEVAGVPTSVPVRVAHELLLAGHHYLDVRTPEEFSAGHPSGAVNIPYMYRVGSGMSKNPDFVKEVSSHFRKHDEIIVGCQLGKRSMMAATDLVAAGFTGITDIAGGYASWTQNGLPTES